MQYDKDRRWVRSMLRTADIANTINGGMSEPHVKIAKKPNHYLITAKVPGIDPEALEVEIIDKKVIIQHSMDFSLPGKEMTFPKVVAAFPIMSNIDFKKITANKEGEELQVILPFNELANGYRRHIDINR